MFSTLRSICGRWPAWLLIIGFGLYALPSVAQSKANCPWGAMLGGQFNLLSAHDHALLVRTRLTRSFDTNYNYLDRSAGGGQIQQAVVLLGYEWRLGERWSGGGIENVTFFGSSERTFQTGAFLRHCGHIGSDAMAIASGPVRPSSAAQLSMAGQSRCRSFISRSPAWSARVMAVMALLRSRTRPGSQDTSHRCWLPGAWRAV